MFNIELTTNENMSFDYTWTLILRFILEARIERERLYTYSGMLWMSLLWTCSVSDIKWFLFIFLIFYMWQAKNLLDESHPEDIFDEYILGTCPDDDLLTTLDVALQCVNPLPAMRPSMQQVVKMLERVRGDIGSVIGSSMGLSSQLSGSLHNGTNSTTSSSDQSFWGSEFLICAFEFAYPRIRGAIESSILAALTGDCNKSEKKIWRIMERWFRLLQP